MGNNLVTLQEFKAYKGINGNSQDSIISSIIPKVSSLVKTLCRRSFVDYVEEIKVEVVETLNDSVIFLCEDPVISVLSVEESLDYGKTYSLLNEFEHYAVKKKLGTIEAIGGKFSQLPNAYVVQYTAGYETIPDDLKLAVLDLIEYYIKNDAAVHSPKAPGTNSVQIEYISTTSLPAHIKRVLDQYTSHYG